MIDEILARLPDGIFTLRERVEQISKLIRIDIDGDLIAALEREQNLKQELDDLNVKYGASAPAENPTTRKFTRDYLRDELDLPGGEFSLKERVIGRRRWDTDYELVFRTPETPKGYGWLTSYSTGSTEKSDTRPFDDEEEHECTLVRLVPKMSKAWIPAVMPESGT